MATLTTTPILYRVGALLQDATHVRWPKEELLAYLSDGQREICLMKPDACASTSALSLVVGTLQHIPADGVTLLDVVRNLTGSKRAPRLTSRADLDTRNPLWHAEPPAQEVRNYVFDPQNQTVLYVYPPNDGTGQLEIVYAAAPAELTDGATLAVNPVWQPALVNYVLYRCYSKDAEYAGNAAAATAYYTAFTAQLGAKTSSEAASDVNANAK